MIARQTRSVLGATPRLGSHPEQGDYVMETLKTKPKTARPSRNSGDETFMSADDLRNYMTEMQMAKATKSVDGMDRAEKARQELIKRLAEPIDLTPERLKEICSR